MRKIRIGIDVGGTHTKAVAIDNDTNEIVGKGSVMTTHHDKNGVAQGVVDAFTKCLNDNNISPEEVIFIAHSTTQATNALLEGDVANVGVIGLAKGGLEGFMAKRQLDIGNIELGTGKTIKVNSEFVKIKDFNRNKASEIIQNFKEKGSQVIVASKAFGVDDLTEEKIIVEEAIKHNMPVTAASDISKLYGLKIRTTTAALNASILPKMLETANSTEKSVKTSGVKVPLMIMRGDGGVMEIDEMRKKPILTMLSGPAASVIGALMYLRASNGIYFEVGGTSTNVGIIKDSRPAVDYSIIGGHRTYVNSLDVRVLGVAGGSMVRASNNEIVDVGPRSAHIANMGYCAFTDPKLFDGAELYTFRPTENDPEDYIAVRLNDGSSMAITNTCAANALKMLDDGDYAKGNYDSSYKAIDLLAKRIGKTVEETANEILTKSCEKIIPVIEDLIQKYKVEREQVVLVGAGGGAGTLLAYTAKLMNFKYQIPTNAEVISSIGVALAMVREMVQRTIPNPSAEEILELKKEAKELAMNSGAVEESVEVYIEIDDQAQTVSAIAMGSTEVKTTDLSKNCNEEEAKEIAAESMGINAKDLVTKANNGQIYVFSAMKNKKMAIRIVDRKGFIKLQRANGDVAITDLENLEDTISILWGEAGNYTSEIVLNPDIYVIAGSKVVDYSGLTELEQVTGMASSEFSDTTDEIIVVAAKNEL
ncbi:MAG: hydantoinase/oxoprolinase family protein [Miniphocaeibacter sp.]|uniref:hydantoinase/oxoprolinase family protein n=1 Tax=Miniphocaeibacter sp. TaxID=3100973 RepID=UPI0017964879|nr:hydantoinase/oxoprolinase family protein [Gallicola sp.]